MATRRPNRTLGPFHNEFWDWCNRSEFRLQQCDTCGRIEWPPTSICSECLGEKLVWTRLRGTGTILTHSIFEKQYYPECPTPWATIMVELDEGPLFISNPQNMPPHQLRQGTRVKVCFIDCVDDAGEFKLPVFEPDVQS